jgi:uncharacterized repeat protein (TIGR03806 family)
VLLIVAFACLTGGCDDQAIEVARPQVDLQRVPYDSLEEYGFFVGNLAAEQPAEGVVPYTVAAPLWADHAEKGRFFVLPPGTTIDVSDADEWRFPLGTVIIKSFSYSTDLRDVEGSRTLIETRLLIQEEDGWSGHTYIWNDEQTEATRLVPGRRIQLSYVDAEGMPAVRPYIVPNTNQCKNCHEIDDRQRTLGPVTRQMADQLPALRAAGILVDEPAADEPMVDPFGDAPLDKRARSYLDANCAHCHRPGGGGGPSGLVLLAGEDHPATYGVCKSPVAAGPGAGGRLHDITPGEPDQSIFIYRMSSTDPEIKMPEIPNLVVDQPGVELISEWITQMDGDCGQ